MPQAGKYYLLSVFFLCGLFSARLYANELEDLVTESRKLVAGYELQLQTAYDEAYQANDSADIENVCKKASTLIAMDFAKDGWTISRTSLEVLNRDNAPDNVEHDILNRFHEKQAEGTPTERLSWYKFTEIANHSEFRYIRAFELAERCMSCHTSTDKSEGLLPLAAYTLKKIRTKNYFPDKAGDEPYENLPVFEE